MNLYMKIIAMPDVYVALNDLFTYPDSDVKTYLYMRIIGNMDEVFPSVNYLNDDFIRMKKQEIESMNKK